MPKFNIIAENPVLYKNEILRFWEEYLPGTPPQRFEWMNNNTADPTIWLFAIEETTSKLAGTLSLFPKKLFYNGKLISAAIVGDFMLHKNYRVFGPALALLKEAITYQKRKQFDFLYTIPNSSSKKIVEKAGFSLNGELVSLMSPLHYDFFLEKYVGSSTARLLQKPLLTIVKLLSPATYYHKRCIVEEIDWENKRIFEKFSETLQTTHPSLMTGEYNLPYFTWRYGQNPEFDFKIVTAKDKPGGDIQGIFIFTTANKRLELYDIIAHNKRYLFTMINYLAQICKKEDCRGVYCLIHKNSPLLSTLKRCCFFDIQEQADVLTYPGNFAGSNLWHCTSADRNI